jgi:hypothetical protein
MKRRDIIVGQQEYRVSVNEDQILDANARLSDAERDSEGIRATVAEIEDRHVVVEIAARRSRVPTPWREDNGDGTWTEWLIGRVVDENGGSVYDDYTFTARISLNQVHMTWEEAVVDLGVRRLEWAERRGDRADFLENGDDDE